MSRKFATAASLLLLIISSFGAAVRPAQAQEPLHNLVVNVYWVEANGYVEGVHEAEIVVTREGEVDPICGGTQSIVGDYNFWLDCWNEILPGDLVQLFVDGDLAKDHSMIFVTLDMADLETGLFSGNADPYTEIEMVVCHPDFDCWSEYTNTGDGDYWEVTFVDLAFYPDWFAVFALEGDGDMTQADFDWPATPSFEIEPNHGWVCAWGWEVGIDLYLTIDDGDPDNGIFIEDTLTTMPDEWEPDVGVGCFEFGQQVDSGMFVQVTDGVTVKETWVAPLTFEAVEDDGTAWGDGAGGEDVSRGHVCLNYEGLCQEIVIDENGGWSAFFIDYDPASLDLFGAHVVLYDGDDDSNMIHLFQGEQPPGPVIDSYPRFDLVNGWNWPLWEEITLVVDDDLLSENGNLLVMTGISEPAPWNPDEPFVSFDLRPFDLQAGQYLIMYCPQAFQIHQVTSLMITGADHELELVTGFAEPGSEVMLVVNWAPGTDYFTTADEDGNWTANYQGQYNLVYGDMITAIQADENQNQTLDEKYIVTPGGLVDEIQNIPDELIADEIKTSLVKKVENAFSSYIRGNTTAAVNKLEALINEIDALLGNKISEDLTHHLHVLVYNLIRNFEE